MKARYLNQIKLNNLSGYFYPDRIARHLIFTILEKIKYGRILIIENQETFVFGNRESSDSPHAVLIINDPSVYRSFLMRGTIGAGETFMLGKWSSPDLVNVVRIMSRNLEVMNTLDDKWAILKKSASYLIHKINNNSIRGSRKNIAAHYDLSNDFFRTFLDPAMMYSSAIYPEEASGLDSAAVYKLDHICQKLELKPTDHLLEIGTGWGGMAIHAARKYGCRVTTTTLSEAQYHYARQQIKDAGLEDRITLLLKDYRELEGSYDKIVSIEMIEAVGHKYYSQYFMKCSELLRQDGLMLIQAITMPDQRYERAIRSVDFIQHYIFPGGELPSIEVIAKHISKDTDMQIIGTEDITKHYARTLADWKARFNRGRVQVKNLGFDDVFIRMWEFYFSYCEGGFRERVVGTSQFLFAKPGYRFK